MRTKTLHNFSLTGTTFVISLFHTFQWPRRLHIPYVRIDQGKFDIIILIISFSGLMTAALRCSVLSKEHVIQLSFYRRWRASQSANIGIYHILIRSASLVFVWLTRFVPRKCLQCFSDYSVQQFQILPVIFVSTSHKCDLTSYDSGHRIKGQRGRHSLVDILARFLSVQGIFFSFLSFIFSSMATTVIRLSECLSDTSIIEVLISHR